MVLFFNQFYLNIIIDSNYKSQKAKVECLKSLFLILLKGEKQENPYPAYWRHKAFQHKEFM